MDDPVDSDEGRGPRGRRAASRRLGRALERLGGWLLPPRCVLCGASGQPPALDLCPDCEAALPADAAPLQAGPAPLGWCYAPFRYGPPLDHLVQALKYRSQLATGRVLGTLLARRLARLRPLAAVDALLPVPLHPARHAARGFNQSAEIARPLARALGRPLRPGLARRVRDTPTQVGLEPHARRRNLERAFATAGAAGLRVLLVDDVTTTGSTLRELADALLAAGARSVDAACVARAARPGIHAAVRGEPSP